MRIAITSCSDPLDAPDQPVWAAIAAHQPDHLLLLGDQIYMDYGIGNNPRNGAPASMPDLDFAAALYVRYRSQWQVLRDSGLFGGAGLKVHGIWDDHDFGWNNSYGVASGLAEGNPGKLAMPPRKQRITRHAFRQFFAALHQATYPADSLTSEASIDALHEDLMLPVFHSDLLAPSAREGLVPLGAGVRLLLTDGRSFRTAQSAPVAERSLLGSAQWAWLSQALSPYGINLLASGSTLDAGGEPWTLYGDYQKLRGLLDTGPLRRTLALTGDIHNTDLRKHHGQALIELVASGAARPFGNVFRPDRGNYILLDVKDDAIDVLRSEGEGPSPRLRRARLDRASWTIARA